MSESEVKEEEIKPKTQEEFYEIERRDEDQILRELQGEMLEEFVYSFPSGGRTVTGLSWAGVKEAARRMGSVKVTDLEIEDKETYWIVKCKATDEVNRLEMWGVSQQSKTMEYRNGKVVEDMFALSKAVSKAQRNAIRTLIPEKFMAKMIAAHLEGKNKSDCSKTPKTVFKGFGKE